MPVKVKDLDCCAAGTQVNPLVMQVQVRLTILTVEDYVTVSRLQSTFNQLPGNENTIATPVNPGSGLLKDMATFRLNEFDAGAFEHAEPGLVDTLHAGLG
jgi:hypothetical protein